MKDSVPFSSTELEGEKQGQDELPPHHPGPRVGLSGAGDLHTHLAKSCLQHLYMV